MKKILFLIACTSIVFAKSVGDIQITGEKEEENNYNSAICNDVVEILKGRLFNEFDDNKKDSIHILINCFEGAEATGEDADLRHCFDEKTRLLGKLK